MSEVMQQDRDAAARLIEAYWPFGDKMQQLADSYRAGHSGGVWAVAFATHREEAARNARREALSEPVLQLVREARVSALKEACLAVASERLNDATGDAGDEAYNRAIGDALAAILALGESQS